MKLDHTEKGIRAVVMSDDLILFLADAADRRQAKPRTAARGAPAGPRMAGRGE